MSKQTPEAAQRSEEGRAPVGISASPLENAGWFSICFFNWLLPLLRLGNKRPLEFEDVPELPSGDLSYELKRSFREQWELEKTNPSPSVGFALWRSFRRMYIWAGVLKLVHDAVMFFGPIGLNLAIDYLESGNRDIGPGLGIAFGMLAAAVVESMTLRHYFFLSFRVGMQCRGAALTEVYEKSLKLSVGARSQFSSGEISNLMSVDGMKLQNLTGYLQNIWSAPLQIIVSIALLARSVGWASLGGLAMMIIMIPLSAWIAGKLNRVQIQIMVVKDERIRAMEEILSGMKIIKLQAWEDSFENRVNTLRSREIRLRFWSILYQAFSTAVWASGSALVSAVTFGIYVGMGNVLTVSAAFTSISLFNILRFPISMLPSVINNVIEARVSINRIERFLLAEEMTPTSEVNGDKAQITMEHCDIAWPVAVDGKVKQVELRPALSDLSFHSTGPELVAIVGPVGSGKSTMVNAILGEAYRTSGTLSYTGSISYVSQTAYIQNASLRENILFGMEFEADRYNRVLDSCALLPDLEILPGRDMTEIGEKGINLSGGQRARVALARAAYHNSDMYVVGLSSVRCRVILDDPLSAVDVHVAKHIFSKCIKRIFKDKLVLLITNAVEFLPQMDRILMIDQGKIIEEGRYQDMIKEDGVMKSFMKALEVNRGSSQLEEEARLSSEQRESRASDVHATPTKATDVNKQSLTTVEKKFSGRVAWQTYSSYILSLGGLLIFVLLIVAYLINEGLSVFLNFWINIWTADMGQATPAHGIGYYIGVYIGTTVIGMVVSSLTAFWFRSRGLQSSIKLHNSMLNCIMFSPMQFFDQTPQGRITNRFSKDIEVLDQTLPDTVNSFFVQLMRVISTAVVIIYATPWFTLVLIPIIGLYFYSQEYYLRSSREIKRLDYAQFTETLDGVSTIRAYKDQKRFIWTNEMRVNQNQRAYFISFSSNCWLALRLEFAGSIIVFAATLLAILNRGNSSFAGIAALSISYSLNVTQSLNWLVRMTSDMETNIVSVERINEYSNQAREASMIVPGYRPPEGWPSRGEITIDHLTMRYRPDLEPVLKSLTASIQSCEKIGIVGRTGSGKSSLLMTILRMIEFESGTVTIDEYNVKELGLHDLRSRISVIPQEPILFSGTIRSNMDPFSRYTDANVWEALERTSAKPFVTELGGLESVVLERGSNLSVGQRQLICIGRAVLRKSRIIMMDEATSSIDIKTDVVIQKTITDVFKDCTVLTVAHRINTIINSDRVMTIDGGELVEFDSPSALTSRESLFAVLLEEYKKRGQNGPSADAAVPVPK